MIIHGSVIAVNLTVQDNLRLLVTKRFQQNGIHVDMGSNAGRFRLNDLGPTDLKAFGGDPGVVGHVLGFERRHMLAMVLQIPADAGSNDAFAHI